VRGARGRHAPHNHSEAITSHLINFNHRHRHSLHPSTMNHHPSSQCRSSSYPILPCPAPLCPFLCPPRPFPVGGWWPAVRAVCVYDLMILQLLWTAPATCLASRWRQRRGTRRRLSAAWVQGQGQGQGQGKAQGQRQQHDAQQ
jgi:hypothetical protein